MPLCEALSPYLVCLYENLFGTEASPVKSVFWMGSVMGKDPYDGAT